MNTTETTDTPQQVPAVGAPLDRWVGHVAYLYHDASTPEDAHPWLHSTLLVLAADRRPKLRNETPLVTLAQAEAMVAAERERFAKLCETMAAGARTLGEREDFTELAARAGYSEDSGELRWIAPSDKYDWEKYSAGIVRPKA